MQTPFDIDYKHPTWPIYSAPTAIETYERLRVNKELAQRYVQRFMPPEDNLKLIFKAVVSPALRGKIYGVSAAFQSFSKHDAQPTLYKK